MAADPLASLKDIHLPPPVPNWPIAPGWIVIYCLIITLIGLYIYHQVRRYLQNHYQREALQLLLDIQQSFRKKKSLSEATSALNTLLKRIALIYYPRAQVAELHSQAWIDFLNQTGEGIDFSLYRDYLLNYPYQKSSTSPVKSSKEMSDLFKVVELWIKQQRKRR